MRMRRLLLCAAALPLYLALDPAPACAQTYTVLHAFTGEYDGAALWGPLALDAQGNVYGTTAADGPYCGGTVFELSPQSGGMWAFSLLAAFNGNTTGPSGSTAGLTLGPKGTLYGTSRGGGMGAGADGTVLELTPQSGGWALSVLYNFPLPGDGGCCPYGGVAIDKEGNLFGNADWAYELSPGASGWTATILHEFGEGSGDASAPWAPPILDAAGNLYGITLDGGVNGHGAVYMLHPTSTGWQEYLLHSFPAFTYDGQSGSLGALAMDASGSLYGTTNQGGRYTCVDVGCGIVFRLARESGGKWEYSILHNFTGGLAGSGPGAGVVLDKEGNLYGTTIYDGSEACACGVVYKLSPTASGPWTYTVLHTFIGSDGAQPDANLVIDSLGNLYGTTPTGGAGGFGVAFELTP
jgi:uncharacterized repeat protein (TIGR03803 family)